MNYLILAYTKFVLNNLCCAGIHPEPVAGWSGLEVKNINGYPHSHMDLSMWYLHCLLPQRSHHCTFYSLLQFLLPAIV